MGFFTIDWTLARDDLVDAIESHREHRDDARAEAEVSEAAKHVPTLTTAAYTHQVMRLLKFEQYDRALQLVGCFGPLDERVTSPRSWVRISLLILFWPFILIYRLVKLGLPK